MFSFFSTSVRAAVILFFVPQALLLPPVGNCVEEYYEITCGKAYTKLCVCVCVLLLARRQAAAAACALACVHRDKNQNIIIKLMIMTASR